MIALVPKVSHKFLVLLYLGRCTKEPKIFCNPTLLLSSLANYSFRFNLIGSKTYKTPYLKTLNLNCTYESKQLNNCWGGDKLIISIIFLGIFTSYCSMLLLLFRRNFHLFYNIVSTETFVTLTLGYQPQVRINTCSLNKINIYFVGVEIFHSIIGMVNQTSKCCSTPLSSI